MQTHQIYFVSAVILWVSFTDSDCSSEEESRHRDETNPEEEVGEGC